MQSPPFTLYIAIQDEITVTDVMKKKLLIFDNEGNFVKEIPISLQTPQIFGVSTLKNGNYLSMKFVIDPTSDYLIQYTLGLQDSEFKEINDLDEIKFANFLKGKKLRASLLMIKGV